MEPNNEAGVKDLFEKYANVAESASLYDTILVCRQFYGSENNVQGWYTNFNDFSKQETQSFFKARTESIANAAYCNQQNADSMDFAFLAYSMGITFWAPATQLLGETYQPIEGAAGLIAKVDPVIGHLWQFDLPRHCAIQFKTNQDIRAEAMCYAAPPGYGPTGGGAASEVSGVGGGGPLGYLTNLPTINIAGTQGIPVHQNRFKFPEPIGIPRTATIEGVLNVSDIGRYLLEGVYGPRDIVLQPPSVAGAPPFDFFPARFAIQFSLFGKRLVQQRGQYHV